MLLLLLPAVAFGVLTYSCAIAIYNARHDPYELFFVISTYALVLFLFLTLRALERARAGERGLLVVAVWLESVLLNFSFAGRVAELLPPTMSLPVWLSAFLVAAVGFWLCFGFG